MSGGDLGQARIPGDGWLALLGGGEFSFGETLDADGAWEKKVAPGPVGFIPAASGSSDYGHHLAEYLGQTFGRQTETIPIYRARDARRGRNGERIATVSAVYLGGGVTDHLLEALAGTPAAEALAARLRTGGVVVAIAAAAQSAGRVARSIFGGGVIPGLGWLPRAAVEPNFDLDHDRRLRKLAAEPGVELGLGIPAGSAVLLGPAGAVEIVGTAFVLASPAGEFQVLEEDDGAAVG